MKNRYGQNFRRNIRYDDVDLTFCIDILIPGNNPKWETVGFQRALADCKIHERETEKKCGNALSSRAPVPATNEPGKPTTSSSTPPTAAAAATTAAAAAAAATDVSGSSKQQQQDESYIWGTHR